MWLPTRKVVIAGSPSGPESYCVLLSSPVGVPVFDRAPFRADLETSSKLNLRGSENIYLSLFFPFLLSEKSLKKTLCC